MNLLMRTVGKDSYYYMYNGHADVTALINAATGKVDATYYYDAFGNILESTENVNNNILMPGTSTIKRQDCTILMRECMI